MDYRLFQIRMKMVNSSSNANGDSANGRPFMSLTVTICALSTTLVNSACVFALLYVHQTIYITANSDVKRI